MSQSLYALAPAKTTTHSGFWRVGMLLWPRFKWWEWEWESKSVNNTSRIELMRREFLGFPFHSNSLSKEKNRVPSKKIRSLFGLSINIESAEWMVCSKTLYLSWLKIHVWILKRDRWIERYKNLQGLVTFWLVLKHFLRMEKDG